MTTRMSAWTIVAVISLALAACGTPGGSSGSPPPTPTPSPRGIAHPTGSAEVVLRFDEAGGFVPVEFFAAHVPYFTLYGDGTVVFVGQAPPAGEYADGPVVGPPLRTARLDEAAVQALLEFALGDGGLATARAEYDNQYVADAPTAVFEVHANGAIRRVSVVALGMGGTSDPDEAIKAALAGLADRLRAFDPGSTVVSRPYVPTDYRGILLDSGGVEGAPIRPWPWPSLAPTDFAQPANPNVYQRRTAVLTPTDALATGVDGFESGVTTGLWYRRPDGAVYGFVLRPLLPDEAA